jgi:serine/threonine protein phosphatase PrpC
MGMQGWRKSMEDSHIANLEMEGGVCVFGVFDGHGGK